MTLVNSYGPHRVLMLGSILSGTPFIDSMLIDASGEKALLGAFKVPKTGNITTIRFRTATVTTWQDLSVGIYTINPVTGNPTTTAYGGMTVATVTGASTDDNVEKVATLGTAASAVKGDMVAVVAEFVSTAGNLNLGRNGMLAINQGYTGLYTAGAWAKNQNSPLIAVGYDDGTYEVIAGCTPYTGGLSAPTFHSGSTPDEHGAKWTPDVPARVWGLYVTGFSATAASSSFDVVVYNDTVVITSESFDGDNFAGTSARATILPFSTPVTVSSGSARIFALKPTSGITIQAGYGTVGATASLAAGLGTNFVGATRTDGGTWTEQSNRQYFIFPIYDQLDDGAGGGTTTTVIARGRPRSPIVL